MKLNLDNGTGIHYFKLRTANEQIVDTSIANRKGRYELKNSVFPEYEHINFNIINYLQYS